MFKLLCHLMHTHTRDEDVAQFNPLDQDQALKPRPLQLGCRSVGIGEVCIYVYAVVRPTTLSFVPLPFCSEAED